ncbi:MAG: type II secretion system protein [Pseudobdellovibrionaceae bacterium]
MSVNFLEKRKSSSGYSLLSIAISVVIIGILFSAIAGLYSIYSEHKKIQTTEERVQTAVNKIQTFRQVNGRYPCPSSLNAARGSAAYGTESDCSDTVTYIQGADCSASGVCVVAGSRSLVPEKCTPQVTPCPAITPRVRIGTIPFRILQIDEKNTFDAYGSRLYYAVTERQGVEDTYSDVEGGIEILDESGNTIVDPSGSASFVIVSSGPNRLGAFSVDGVQGVPCTGAGQDVNNCLDLVTPPAAASYRSNLAALGGAAVYFDDTIDYFSVLQDPVWKRTTANNNNIEALMNGGVGAGQASPSETLDVTQNLATSAGGGVGATWDGALRVAGTGTTTSLQADEICELDGTRCFDVTAITGSTLSGEGMACTNAGEYMIGIENGAAKCGPIKVACPAGQVLTGLNASGVPVCSPVYTGCAAGNVQLCRSDFSTWDIRNSNVALTNPIAIGAGSHGATQAVTDPGSYPVNPAIGDFRCNNSVWEFVTGTNTGLCPPTCIAPPWSGGGGTLVTNTACPGSGLMLAITTTTFNAGTCSTSSTTDYTPCDCLGHYPIDPLTGEPYTPHTPKPADAVAACGAGYNDGNITTTHVWDSNNMVCNWVTAPAVNTCSCTLAGLGAQPPNSNVACNLRNAAWSASNFSVLSYVADTGTPPNTGGVGHCQWNPSYDDSACTCDTTTEYPAGSSHSSICNTTCDTQTTPAVWVHTNYTLGMTCPANPDYVKTPAVCSWKTFTWDAVSATGSVFSSNPGGIPDCGTSCRTSPVTPSLPAGTTEPFSLAGGAACPELNTSGTCLNVIAGQYHVMNAKCWAH